MRHAYDFRAALFLPAHLRQQGPALVAAHSADPVFLHGEKCGTRFAPCRGKTVCCTVARGIAAS
jgi:hypothetical protein